MSVATESRSHAPYAEPDEYIDYQLRKTQTGIKRIDMLTAAIVAITVLIGYVLLFVLSDHWLFEGGVGGTARVLMFLPVIGFVGWLIGAKVIWPALRTVSGLYAARTLEASSTEFRSGLLNLVDLKQAGREVSPLILATMEKRAAVTLAKFNVDDAIDKRPLLRTLYVLFGIVVAFCLYSVLSPKKLGPSVLRAIVPFTNVTPATQTEILKIEVRELLRSTEKGLKNTPWLVAPEILTLRAGALLEVRVDCHGEQPAEVFLLRTTVDRSLVDDQVSFRENTDLKLFEGSLGSEEHPLLQSFTYRIVAGDAQSPEYRVEIITPPSATVTEVRYDYPEYTELDPRTQMGGAIDVLEQTTVTITAVTNMAVKRAEIEFADTENFSSSYPGSTIKKSDGDKKLTTIWRTPDLKQTESKFPKFYRIKVWNMEDTPDPKPAHYPINVRVDQTPQVVLIDPTTNLEVPANATIPLVVAARDPDFKLSRVELKRSKEGEDGKDQRVEPMIFNGIEKVTDQKQEVGPLRYDFSLELLQLNAGDKIRIWVEAQDNRMPIHNLAKTPPIEITIKGKVTKDEAKKQLDEQKKEQQQRLDEAAKNNDQPNEQSPSDPANSPDQPPRDPNESEPPKDKGDEAQKDPPQQKGQQQQEDKNSKGQQGGSGKTQKGGEGKKSETGGEGKSDKPGQKGNTTDGKQSLKNDGTQDQEALEQIAKRDLKKHGRPPKKTEQQSSSSAQREPQENSAGEPPEKGTDQKAGDPKQGDPKQGDPKQGDPKQGDPKQGDPKQGDPKQGDPKQGDPKQGDPKQGDPKQGDPKQGDPKQGDPKQGDPKAGGKKAAGQPGKKGDGKASDSDSDSNDPGAPGAQGSKKGKGKAGSGPGSGTPSNFGNPSAPNGASGSSNSSSDPEEANEEFTKEAANLVLKRLQKEIERGEVDQELLDELGWTPEQMKKFVDRMQQQLEAKQDDDSPQAKAKQRQFEEMLKNLNLTEKTQRRDDTNKDKQTGDGIGPVRRPPPPEIREEFERYTKSLSKKKTAETPKK